MHISGLQETTARGHRHMHGKDWQTDLDWNRGLSLSHFTMLLRNMHITEAVVHASLPKKIFLLFSSGAYISTFFCSYSILFLSLIIEIMKTCLIIKLKLTR